MARVKRGINLEDTQCGGDVNVDVKVEAGVFEEAKAALPFFGPVSQLHEVADAIGREDRRRGQENVLRANLQPHVLLRERDNHHSIIYRFPFQNVINKLPPRLIFTSL